MSYSKSTGTDAPNGVIDGPNRFQVLTVDYSYDNPVAMEPEDVDKVSDQLPDYRKLSVISSSMYQKSGRRSSRDMGIQVTNTSILPELFPTSSFEDPQWYQLTQDAIPRAEHYRRSTSVSNRLVRPTLEELHNPKPDRKNDNSRKISVMEQGPKDGQQGAIKFGWIRGVYIRCLLNIWGVMLFLRMGWMVGQAGMGYSILIVLVATVITIVTTLSMSAICTNGEVKGGGVYYMISRSLGPEFGGAIGMIFFCANSVAVSMYIVGAAETVKELLLRFHEGIVENPSDINDVRVSGVILLIFVVCVTGVGMAFENKAQLILLVILLAALFDYFVGACLPPNVEQVSKGFIGWNMEVGKENFYPGFGKEEGFFSVFSIFFPSVIGILAGANISGDLKDPSSAIPKGTILAILSTSFSYILIIILLGCTLLRNASGDLDVANRTINDLSNMDSIHQLSNCSGRCPHGMLNYNPVMEMTSAFGPLIFCGIFAACLSSALAALVSAPRIFQALCNDRIFPKLEMFGKGYGVNNDPRRATAIVFVIALLCTCIGQLDAIAPVISNFFMCSYCLVNFSCFHATFVKSPGFRPAFRYYNQWLSLVGSLVCLVVMFIMSWITALATLAIVLGLYIYIHRNQPDVNWGSSTQGYIYKNALTAVTKLSTVEDHVKNYRPAILVLTGNCSSRPPLVDIAYTITKNLGLMVCGHVIKNTLSPGLRKAMIDHNVNWLMNRKVKAFYSLFQCESLDDGIRAQLELVGLGKMRPNLLLIGYKSKWQNCSPKSLEEYFNAIHAAFDLHMSVAILRLKEGLDYKNHLETDQGIPYSDAPNSIPKNKKSPNMDDMEEVKVTRKPPIKEDSSDSDSESSVQETKTSIHLEVMPSRKVSRVVPDVNAKLAYFRRLSTVDVSKLGVQEIPAPVINSLNVFQKNKRGFIDVWWLYDDGGLTMLIPYLLTTRSLWKSCQLRVFCISHKKNALDQTQVNMQSLLKKFRIDFSAVTIVPDVSAEPKEENKRQFQKLISPYVSESDITKNNHTITKTDLEAHKERTKRHIRLRELLDEHSTNNASLILMTLPMPRKKACPPPLYMAWLETLTRDMPPFLLIRGNQESVLTYYS